MTSSSDQEAARPWARRFYAIWAGQAFSLFGSMLVQFALVWWLTSTTGSATVLATATIFAILPQVFIGPFAGALVDRWDRRKVMIFADGSIALVTVGLVILYATGRIQVWHVYAAMLLRSALGAFHFPAMQASTSLLVPDKQLARVNGLNQGLYGLMNIVAPPLGALLLGVMPLHQVLAIDIVTALLAILPLLFVTIPQPPDRSVAAEANLVRAMLIDMAEGFRYVRAWPGLLILIIVAMALNFVLVPSGSLMPLLVTEHFHGGTLQLGWLESAMGIGVVSGGILLGAWGGFKRRILTSMMGVIGIGLGTVLVGVTPAGLFGVALAGMFISGFMNPMANGPLFAIVQSTVEPGIQGRVMSLIGSGSAAMMPISLLLAGPLADAVGIRTWYVLGGVICIAIALSCLAVRPLMEIEQNGHARAAADAPAGDPGARSSRRRLISLASYRVQ